MKSNIRIERYILEFTQSQRIDISGTPLSVMYDANDKKICLYSITNDDSDTSYNEYEIKLILTGLEIKDTELQNFTFLGSVTMSDSTAVHIFCKQIVKMPIFQHESTLKDFISPTSINPV